jgi:hypothetical protein
MSDTERSTDFGTASVKQGGTPVNPYELCFETDKGFDTQVMYYINYWLSFGRDMSKDSCWEDYQRIINEKP